MPREIRTEQDLPPEQRKQRQKERDQQAERAKDPKALTLDQRIARIEKILGID